jgi:hypothetical protein
MSYYVLVEVEDGNTVVELEPEESVEEAAIRAGGLLVDTTTYRSYEEAYEALEQLVVLEEDFDVE